MLSCTSDLLSTVEPALKFGQPWSQNRSVILFSLKPAHAVPASCSRREAEWCICHRAQGST